MNLKHVFITLNAIFLLLIGFLSALIVVPFPHSPLNFSQNNAPQNWISQENIQIYDDKVVIEIENPSISQYAWSGSMRPVLDGYSNGIRIIPKTPEEINIGDIITFEDNGKLIIHRVIDKGTDEEGIYFITKGDNNLISDGKIRFEDIKYVTIAIIY